MEREESLRNRVMTANHPPGAFRLNNSVRHLDAWYDAFNVGPEQRALPFLRRNASVFGKKVGRLLYF